MAASANGAAALDMATGNETGTGGGVAGERGEAGDGDGGARQHDGETSPRARAETPATRTEPAETS